MTENSTQYLAKLDKHEIRNRSVRGFFGHTNGPLCCCSNFYPVAMTFLLPSQLPGFDGILATKLPTQINVSTSEHAIMLCKACVMGDLDSYAHIAMSDTTPAQVKQLGRKVQGFDQTKWDTWVRFIAEDVVYQKFNQNKILATVLLSTGDDVLAETAPRDRIWGIGMGKSNPDIQDITKWKGQNILGYALMAVRDRLRADISRV